jgi:hypothetical protein
MGSGKILPKKTLREEYDQGVTLFGKAPAQEECNGVACIDLGGRVTQPHVAQPGVERRTSVCPVTTTHAGTGRSR